MKNLDYIRKNFRSQILALGNARDIGNIRVFGSFISGKQDDGSDIDFLVTAGAKADLLALGGFQYELEELLNMQVDVVAENWVKNWKIPDPSKNSEPL